jgi:putative sugar O-methyltransferase
MTVVRSQRLERLSGAVCNRLSEAADWLIASRKRARDLDIELRALKSVSAEQAKEIVGYQEAYRERVGRLEAHIAALTAVAVERENRLQELLATPPGASQQIRTAGLRHSDGQEIIDRARRHLAEALNHRGEDLPSYGSRWQPQVDAMRRDIPALPDAISALHYAQYHITFDGRPPFPADPLILQFREWAVANEFPHLAAVLQQMSENPFSGPDSLGEFNGRIVSTVLFYHARCVLAGMHYADNPQAIVEIGGGYGEIARLWLTNQLAPARSYAIIDIPECLFFAEVGLKLEFGERVGYFDGADPGTPILLVPLTHLDRFSREADLVINTGSMQEMTEEWIDFYIAWLNRFPTRSFYSLNYAAQPLSVMGESRNLWTQRLGHEWSTRHLRLNIPLLDLAGPTRDYLEVLYEKVPAERNIREWSVFRGHLLSKTTYVEGLDLLRQDLTIEHAKMFLDQVLHRMSYHPKEVLYIAGWLAARGRREYDAVVEQLQQEQGGMLYHAPPPPATD